MLLALFAIAFSQITVAHGADQIATIPDLSPIEVCSLLASPGDFVLQVIPDNSSDVLEFGELTSIAIKAKNILNFNLPVSLSFSHAEFITEIQERVNLVTWSFYPPIFSSQPSEHFRRYANDRVSYRNNFVIYRVDSPQGSVAIREKALAKLRTVQDLEQYWEMGTCADFINWAYDDHITTWWNFVPGIQKILSETYPPEAISTPDDLAQSPDTRKICEVREMTTLVYPQKSFNSRILHDDLREAMKSSNVEISSHARDVLDFFIERRVFDKNGMPLTDRIQFIENKSKSLGRSHTNLDRFLDFRKR